MSTRSRIAVLQPDGKVISIYCHHDGYYSHNGEILLENYMTDDEANALVALGDISSLDEDIDLTEAYQRDRGEEFSQLVTESLDEYNLNRNDHFEAYNYLWMDKKWHTRVKNQWVDLEDVINDGEDSEDDEE